jgi:hypothetical protein
VSSRRILAAYRGVYCLLLLVASLQTLGAAHAAHAALHEVPLAALEIAGLLLLLWRRTQWGGLSLLLLAFAGAQLLAAGSGAWPTRFLQYAAGALFIVLLDRSLGGAAATEAAAAARGATAG